MSREYVVLRSEPAEITTWKDYAAVTATSSEAAVRACAQEGGAYVAIPKRSFQQVMVEVETAPRVKIISGESA